MTKSINSGEFTIVLILIVLCATVFFCHALLRVFLLMYRGDLPSRGGMGRTQHYLSPGGYAVPQEPIPVVLAQDEDVREAAEDVNKITPPAYGLWRGSVVSSNRLWTGDLGPARSKSSTRIVLTEQIACRSEQAILAEERYLGRGSTTGN